jgi:hypothetical protein
MKTGVISNVARVQAACGSARNTSAAHVILYSVESKTSLVSTRKSFARLSLVH